MESNGRFYARPFNELHVRRIKEGLEPLNIECVTDVIEKGLFLYNFSYSSSDRRDSASMKRSLYDSETGIYVLPKTMRLRSIVFTRSI